MSSFTTSSISIDSGRLMLIGVCAMNAGDVGMPLDNITLSDSGSHTWTTVAGVEWTGFWGFAQKWFRAVKSGSGSISFTASMTGGQDGGFGVHVLSYSGYDPGNPIGLTASSAFNSPLDGSYSLALGGTTAASSSVLGSMFCDAQPNARRAPGTGWTELVDGDGNYDVSVQLQDRVAAVSSVDWADLYDTGSTGTLYVVTALAIEIKAAAEGQIYRPKIIMWS
ncbi:MAG: hypothetical protein NZM12_01460 [Steroidobacteraceae bacterium]|nr:hypothetical protein [Steroidobacteraceae bacterium]